MIPEFDHVAPNQGRPTHLHVMDRRDNRRGPGWESRGSACRSGSFNTGASRPHRTRVRPSAKNTSTVVTPAGPVARELDQFYTNDAIAAGYLQCLGERYDLTSCLLVEPSAGDGAFHRHMLANSVAIDIDPKRAGIVRADYLSLKLTADRRVITVGNPPFGRIACLAVRFFNHAALQSDVIAMILPRSVLKASIENRLNPAFHLVHGEQVPSYAFRLDAKRRDVAAVFQIWERRSAPRELRIEATRHRDFEFADRDSADFSIRRVGANAGRISRERELHEESHHFIRGNVEHIMARLDLAGAARKATSTPSLAKSEIVALYREWIEKAATGTDTAPRPTASQPGRSDLAGTTHARKPANVAVK